jgi:hypothetical protein
MAFHSLDVCGYRQDTQLSEVSFQALRLPSAKRTCQGDDSIEHKLHDKAVTTVPITTCNVECFKCQDIEAHIIHRDGTVWYCVSKEVEFHV